MHANNFLMLRFYKKLDIEKMKRKPSGDDESVEDVDDDEFEKALGKVIPPCCFFLVIYKKIF